MDSSRKLTLRRHFALGCVLVLAAGACTATTRDLAATASQAVTVADPALGTINVALLRFDLDVGVGAPALHLANGYRPSPIEVFVAGIATDPSLPNGYIGLIAIALLPGSLQVARRRVAAKVTADQDFTITFDGNAAFAASEVSDVGGLGNHGPWRLAWQQAAPATALIAGGGGAFLDSVVNQLRGLPTSSGGSQRALDSGSAGSPPAPTPGPKPVPAPAPKPVPLPTPAPTPFPLPTPAPTPSASTIPVPPPATAVIVPAFLDPDSLAPGGAAAVSASCPPGSALTGGGAISYSASGGVPAGNLSLIGSVPLGGPSADDWLGMATPSAAPVTDTVAGAFAVCVVNGSGPNVIVSSTATTVSPGATATAACPPGTRLTGGGGAVSGGGVTMTASYPSNSDAATSGVFSSWTTTSMSDASPVASAVTTSFAICLPPGNLGPRRVVQASGPGRPVAACPVGSLLVAGGFQLDAPVLPSTHIQGSYPSAADGTPATGGQVPDSWAAAIDGGSGTVFALCAG